MALLLVNAVAKIAFMSLRIPRECLFIVGMLTVTLAAVPRDRNPGYQTVGGWNCHMCPRGTFVYQDCTSDNPTSTVCRNCSQGRFQPNEWTNEIRCYTCDECDPGLDGSLGGEPLTECTIYQNAVCRCADSSFWSQENRRCTPVTKCPPGQGVTHKATIVADTECEPCRHEAFSASASAEETCAPCLICEEWQKEVSPCNRTHDRVCQNVSMATGIPPTVKDSQEVSINEGSQEDNIVAIAVPLGVVAVVVAVVVVGLMIFYRRSKNAPEPNDLEGNIPRDNQELLDGSSSSRSSSRTESSEDASSPGSISTRGGDSLEYRSEPGKSCRATPFREDGGAGTMDAVDGPGDETYPKSFALEPEGDNSMPVQETGGQASLESYRQDSQDPPQSMDKIEKESAGYAVSEIPVVPCESRSGPTPVFPNQIRAGPNATPDQIRAGGDGSSDVGIVGMATRV